MSKTIKKPVEKVMIIQKQIVSLSGCEDYIYEDVRVKLVSIFEDLGGIDRFIDKGDKRFVDLIY